MSVNSLLSRAADSSSSLRLSDRLLPRSIRHSDLSPRPPRNLPVPSRDSNPQLDSRDDDCERTHCRPGTSLRQHEQPTTMYDNTSGFQLMQSNQLPRYNDMSFSQEPSCYLDQSCVALPHMSASSTSPDYPVPAVRKSPRRGRDVPRSSPRVDESPSDQTVTSAPQYVVLDVESEMAREQEANPVRPVKVESQSRASGPPVPNYRPVQGNPRFQHNAPPLPLQNSSLANHAVQPIPRARKRRKEASDESDAGHQAEHDASFAHLNANIPVFTTCTPESPLDVSTYSAPDTNSLSIPRRGPVFLRETAFYSPQPRRQLASVKQRPRPRSVPPAFSEEVPTTRNRVYIDLAQVLPQTDLDVAEPPLRHVTPVKLRGGRVQPGHPSYRTCYVSYV